MYKVSRVIALVTFAAMILVPSLIVVLGSFKTDAEVYNKPLSLPETWSLGNYSRLLSDSDLDISFRNSVFVTVSSVVLTLIFASLASFAIARMITVSGKVLAGLFALGLAIPAQINLVPIIVQSHFHFQSQRWVQLQFSCLLSTGMIYCGRFY